MHDFLARGWTDHSGASFLDGVTALPAANVMVIEPAGERVHRYWGPPQLADDDRPVAKGLDLKRDRRIVDEFQATFNSSVQLRLRSDVPIGTCLSGGLDSSSIVATVARLRADDDRVAVHEQMPRLGFHARFPEHGIDESPYAELVARDAGIPLIHSTPTGEPLLSAVLPVLRAQGEPYGGGSINAQYAVMASARREGIKVLLDGQGADELLGGIPALPGRPIRGPLVWRRSDRHAAGAPSTATTRSVLGRKHRLGWRSTAESQPRRSNRSARDPAADSASSARGQSTARRPKYLRLASRGPSLLPACGVRYRDTDCRPCFATRIATAWPSESRHVCRSWTSG